MTIEHVHFLDRRDAGRRLVARLSKWKDSGAIVYALPRGGVPVAAEVAAAFHWPLDVLYVRKIGAPFQPELALGAIVDGADPDIVFNEDLVDRLGVSKTVLDDITRREAKEIERRRKAYGRAIAPLMPTGRPAVVVDDGLATGATMRAAVKALRRRGATHVIVAVPVAPPDAVAMLEAEGADVVCPHVTARFFGVGSFYQDFRQLTDAEVVAILAEHREKGDGRRGEDRALSEEPG